MKKMRKRVGCVKVAGLSAPLFYKDLLFEIYSTVFKIITSNFLFISTPFNG